ncbi:hypothetical protein DRN02_007805 [Sphingomonas paucimobilis]|uniref:hypothetical protein n=1 Tax=Sphingomonas paucimobilis TaxID=13689 RepID=UPI000DE365D2|nr:hypothetical protein [Sphingomonas paucimobilis]QBE91929.1 hypothetical protein DRN02_007805 [Sphingomonas paucimobilis]
MADTTAQSIDTAPRDGSWVLGYVPKMADTGYVGWIALTWGDKGWVDDNDEKREPSLWTPLPDPQPAATGWQPPAGVIHVEEITGKGWKLNGVPTEVPYRWAVYIRLPDGECDEYREMWHYVTYPEAERRATMWQDCLSLPIKVTSLDPNVVPFAIVGSVQ